MSAGTSNTATLVRDVARWPYPTYNVARGECRLRIWRVEDDSYFGGLAYVAVVSELRDNPSTSVTNSAEYIMAALREELADDFDADASVPLRLIEHYPPPHGRYDQRYTEVTVNGGRPSRSPLTVTRLGTILPGIVQPGGELS